MVRSIVISVIMLVLAIYVGLYVLLSLPSVQEKIKNTACEELSPLLGGNLYIEQLSFQPFSELVLKGVSLRSPEGGKVVEINKVAAGIDLGCLFFERKVVLNYAEIIGLAADIRQNEKNEPLNIQFLIDALSPKDKTKPPTKFDLRLRNIVVRESEAQFSRPWMTDEEGRLKKFSTLSLSNLRMDLSIPTMRNDLFQFDIRNMSGTLSPGLSISRLAADITYAKGDGDNATDELNVRNLILNLTNTSLQVDDFTMTMGIDQPVSASVEGFVTPSDFREFEPLLSQFNTPWNIDIAATFDKKNVKIDAFNLQNKSTNSFLTLVCDADGINKKDSINLNLKSLTARISANLVNSMAFAIPKVSDTLRDKMEKAGDLSLNLKGTVRDSDQIEVEGEILTDLGAVNLEGEALAIKSKKPQVAASIEGVDIDFGQLFSTDLIGKSTFSVRAEIAGFDKNAEGLVELSAEYLSLGGKDFSGIDAYVKKSGNNVHAEFSSADDDLKFDIDGDLSINGANSTLDAFADLARINTEILGLKGKFADSTVGVQIEVHTSGNNADNLTGSLHLSGFNIRNSEGKELHLDKLSLNIDNTGIVGDTAAYGKRLVALKSDWVDARVEGVIHPKAIAPEAKQIISVIFPSLILPESRFLTQTMPINNFNFDIEVKGIQDLYDYLSTPVCPLTEIPIKGYMDSGRGKLGLSLSTPHIRQGKDKLIRDTSLDLSLDSFLGMAKMELGLIFPAKKGDVQIALDLLGVHDNLNVNAALNPTMKSSLKGNVSMAAAFGMIPNPLTGREDLSVHVDIIPSSLAIKETIWNVANGKIDYYGKTIAVNNFLIEHGNQYVRIDGTASESAEDLLRVKLNDIDLDYIFNILNINYVTFGGMATGEVVGRQLLTNTPEAHTKSLRVKSLSYNGAVLGNGELAASYYPEQQEVGIYAVITDPLTRERLASVDGGIWVTRDSLSFAFDANKVNLQFMKPFMQAFCSDLRGKGSGKCKLYGTFSDIDLMGKLRADTISMKIDFTNTWYHAGGDSVFMGKGLIDVPPLTLYDTEGHTAELNGWLRHRYFHDPEFNFKIKDAKSLLCYDTNEKMNPLWYGTIYASGNGQISGKPGIVDIDMNMTTEENSRFYYIISDAEETGSYTFLSFTDKRKEERESLANDSIPDYLHQFMRQVNAADEGSSNVVLSLKGTVTNDALLTLVMDPKAGDKITARGQGSLQMDYNMASDDLRMIGTYVLDEGNYYFTLQDIIIKNFNIKQGSSIKFDGDPMNAILDIAATYRVNTNLTDLDQSFAQDKELNRTNVPVDAILLVDGPMTHPDIDFDIELPTLTSDVERKVKSIVSTNDMMSRQIIYLLALNRFYTQEYTGGTSNSGAEWSSMASSTISSQLSNILSNMTDKLSVAPSFRSDKGDFSDMEFDLALSSRLLNNRLLINGNFGYRDKQTSNTQFVGDFDIEYLLNKTGNLRLKAYNHFNDQNYYLRSALTTQGVGIVFRREFNHLFNLGKKKSPISEVDLLFDKEEKDSTSTLPVDINPTDVQHRDTVLTR